MLEEDEYVEEMRRIIDRDYFPDLAGGERALPMTLDAFAATRTPETPRDDAGAAPSEQTPRPLGRAQFAALLPALLGATDDDALADALWARSRGDPASAAALARSWARYPPLGSDGRDEDGPLRLLGGTFEGLSLIHI